ncbi:MAG: PrsW family intramembrane metalloprotease [Myxococcales bacterium]|nr:PrsW family intramembrane metalloprotease [Myxococcales bacterium]
MLAGLLAFVATAFGVQHLLGLSAPVRLGPASALLFASMPALLWLGYFHSQDRHEPEPKHYVLGAFVLGAFVAGPAASFLIDLASGAPMVGLRLHTLSLDRWVYALAIVGIAQEGSKYVAIRYTLYLSPEFDEPLDGIIYMSATGIGFASYLSYRSLVADGGEIYLSAGAAQAVVTTLAHASFAGILGFAMGHAKFAGHGHLSRATRLAVGLIAAAVCSGCFRVIMDALSVDGLASSPWRRVAFSFGFAAGIFLLTSVLIRRLLAISPHKSEEETIDA